MSDRSEKRIQRFRIAIAKLNRTHRKNTPIIEFICSPAHIFEMRHRCEWETHKHIPYKQRKARNVFMCVENDVRMQTLSRLLGQMNVK